MNKILLIFIAFLFNYNINAQTVSEKLEKSIEHFDNDAQLENAIYSLYVINAETGKVVYAKNENYGLATASCLKLVTSATAYDLLGKDFKFVTKLLYSGSLNDGTINGNLIIVGSGDPTLGSPRWAETTTSSILNAIIKKLQNKGIKNITGNIIMVDGDSKSVTPGNWIWEDLGNYYGAPSRVFNWRENQYDIHFSTTKNIGDATKIINVDPELPNVAIENYTTSDSAKKGDNSIIYLPAYGTRAIVNGTIPANDTNFVVSGSIPNPSQVFANSLIAKMHSSNIKINNLVLSTTDGSAARKEAVQTTLIDVIESPSLEKINYWFMKRSINLYGETFLNKMAQVKTGNYNTRAGVNLVKNYWQSKGISSKGLNIFDGCGLSPANRVTTKTLVKVLQYAQKQPWYNSYLEAFPLYNDMHIKSGTIANVKGFSGYHTAKDGTKYIVSFLVNNYNGSTPSIVGKMFKVLDNLK